MQTTLDKKNWDNHFRRIIKKTLGDPSVCKDWCSPIVCDDCPFGKVGDDPANETN